MTNQEIFDKVATHLRGMQSRAGRFMDNGNSWFSCRYRTADGSRCAIGCLIPDELYDPAIEGDTPSNAFGGAGAALHKVLTAVGLQKEQAPFLNRLQQVHDEQDHWGLNGFIGEDALKNLARAYDLTYTPPA